jgi:anti-sigma28 factor (negative regulator of flagellin synthesis)
MTYQGESPRSSTLLPTDQVWHVSDGVELSNLSAVLNGLDAGAHLIHDRMNETLRAIRRGTYRIDSIQLSRRIVREALRKV